MTEDFHDQKQMIQKHDMTADFEKLTYSAAALKKVWKEIQNKAQRLVDAGWTSYHILSFIDWINQTPHSGILFPGFSMGELMISKPQDGKLNYQQTLSISYDNRIDLFTMQYSDWDKIDSRDEYEKAIQWKVKCRGIDLCRYFLEFLKWNKNWC